MVPKHPIPDARWPTRAEAESSRLFSPLRIGAFEVAERTWVPAMVPWRATADGIVTPEVLDWYGRFADGRPGAVVVEATGIRDIPSGPLLRIGDERFVPGLADLVRTVRERSQGRTRLLIQILDFLAIKRRPEPEKYLARFLAITARHRDALAERGLAARDAPEPDVRRALAALPHAELPEVLSPRERDDLEMGYRERVTDTHLEHVARLPEVLPELFAEAARRAREAGFDGVELHYAHAYTMASFLSRVNDRDDGYGGSREGRVRLAVEVARRVREAVGEDYTVGCRLLGDEVIERREAASTTPRTTRGGSLEAGIDYLSISKRRQVRGRGKQPKCGLRRPTRTRARAVTSACRRCGSTERRPVRPQRSSSTASKHPQARARGGLRDADRRRRAGSAPSSWPSRSLQAG